MKREMSTAGKKEALTLWIEESAIGDFGPIQFDTLNQASAIFRAFTRTQNLGSREAGRCLIRQGHNRNSEAVAFVGFNGRISEGDCRNYCDAIRAGQKPALLYAP